MRADVQTDFCSTSHEAKRKEKVGSNRSMEKSTVRNQLLGVQHSTLSVQEIFASSMLFDLDRAEYVKMRHCMRLRMRRKNDEREAAFLVRIIRHRIVVCLNVSRGSLTSRLAVACFLSPARTN